MFSWDKKMGENITTIENYTWQVNQCLVWYLLAPYDGKNSVEAAALQSETN
jgi:hypothetical protein